MTGILSHFLPTLYLHPQLQMLKSLSDDKLMRIRTPLYTNCTSWLRNKLNMATWLYKVFVVGPRLPQMEFCSWFQNCMLCCALVLHIHMASLLTVHEFSDSYSEVTSADFTVV